MKSCITKYEELKEALVGESEFSHDELVERAKELVDGENIISSTYQDTTVRLLGIRNSLLKLGVHLDELELLFNGGDFE